MDENKALAAYEPQKQELVRPIASAADVMDAHKAMVELCDRTLEQGKDIILIPGTDKPSLSKAGAERINIACNAYPVFETIEAEVDHDRVNKGAVEEWDWSGGSTVNKKTGKKKPNNPPIIKDSIGLYRYRVQCTLKNRVTGQVMGTGEGVCSTMEKKYISRPRDCENTALKMAQKRALVGATLIAYGLSDRFTQDVEDMHFGHKKNEDYGEPDDERASEPDRKPSNKEYAEASVKAQAPMDADKPDNWVKQVTAYATKELKLTKDEYNWCVDACKEQGKNIFEVLWDAMSKHEIKLKGRLLQFIENSCEWPLPEAEPVIDADIIEEAPAAVQPALMDEAPLATQPAVTPNPDDYDPFADE